MERIGHLLINALLKELLIVIGTILNRCDRGSASILLLHAEVRCLLIADALLGLFIYRRCFISQIIHSKLIV